MRAAETRTVSVGTTPTNIRKTADYPNDPDAYPVTYASLRYASGGGTIEMVANPFASGYLLFAALPVNNETIAINGVTYTFKDAASAATDIQIAASKELTATNLETVLNQSTNASITVATYSVNREGAIAYANRLSIVYDTPGTAGNAYTLANSSSSNVTRSAATLTGGLAYGDGQPVDADTDFNDIDQSLARYAVASAGSVDVSITDYFA